MSEEVGEGADANADSEEDGSGGGDDTKVDSNDHEEEDLQHEAEDIHDLEVARKERMDLMEVELSSGEKKGAVDAASVERKTMATDGKEEEEKEKLPPMEKFQYLIGQSEVFAHFLAGELETIDGVGSLCYSCSLSWVHVNSL